MEEILHESLPAVEEEERGDREEPLTLTPQDPPMSDSAPQEEEPPVARESAPDYEERAASDLSEIKQAFPELRNLKSLTELSSLTRYGELREAGLSAVEAAAATQYERLRRPREDTRAHLSSSVPRHTSPTGSRISMGELSAARELFPSLSDREIEALYKRASGSRPQ